ncbi:hypothetical protein J5500_00405 [Candidatus Saccharibacteria bacterium]|nr:hypothetical protein [Candidatus Saccharibacteria bacterium]
MIKKIILYIGLFFGILALMIGALDLVAKIPREWIKQSNIKSAEYMRVRPEFATRLFDALATRSDYYADSVSLSINYGLDPNDSLKSVVLSKYATDDPFITQRYVEQVFGEIEAEQEYLRYWHGYLVVVGPLLTMLSIDQIYIFLAITMCALMIWILVSLYRHKEVVAMIAFTVSMLAVWFFIVPTALEYTWMFLLMLIACLIVMKMVWQGKIDKTPVVFFIFGMLAAYFDFLTTETITLTMPLLLAVWLNRKKVNSNTIKYCIKCALLWFVAFVCTWVAKWILASVVLGENVWPYVSGHIEERLASDFWFGNPIILILMAPLRNLSNLLLFSTGPLGGIVAIFILVTIVVLLKEYRRKKYNKMLLKVLIMIASVPIIRFLVLSNHSFWHHFFTYRALCALVFAGILIIVEMVDWKKLRKDLKVS